MEENRLIDRQSCLRDQNVTIKQEQPESVPDFAKYKYQEETEQQRYNLMAVLLHVSQRDWKISSPERIQNHMYSSKDV